MTGRHVALDPALLAPGAQYLAQVTAIEGFPDASGGDFRTIAYPQAPYATSTQWSGMFGVSN